MNLMEKCDIVQDLIPLYYDDVASEGSRALVDEHIKDCEVCAEMLKNMNENEKAGNQSTDNSEIKAFVTIKKSIIKKTALITFASIAGTIFLMWLFLSVVPNIPLNVPYNADDISVRTFETVTFENQSYHSRLALMLRNDYYGVVFMQKGDTVYFHFRNNIYTRIFGQRDRMTTFGYGTSMFPLASLLYPDLPADGFIRYEAFEENAINRIYYMQGDFDVLYELRTYDDEFVKAAENAVLVWDRNSP
jgi:hypothetical protein